MNNEPTVTHGRLDALDFTKGVLVFFMVVYHALNFSARYELGFRYLAFLPPSFILVTGFLLSRIYLAKPPTRDAETNRRLVIRGTKLFLLFTAINLLAAPIMGVGSSSGLAALRAFFAHGYEVYVVGDGRWVAFEVLLPIAYVLMLGPLILRLQRASRWMLPTMTVGIVAACTLLERTEAMSWNVGLASMGLVGALLGRLPAEGLDWLRLRWWLALSAYLVSAVIAKMLGPSYLVQLIQSCLALAAIFGLGARLGTGDWVSALMIRWGQYSLVAYIGQIALLHVLKFWIPRPEPVSWQFLLLFGATLLLMAAGIELLHRLRKCSGWLDALYRFGFA